MGMKKDIRKRTFIYGIAVLSIVGLILRLLGIRYEGVDYQMCLSAWFAKLKEVGSLRALPEFQGNYNLPYVTAMLVLTYLPVEPIISIKLLSIVFDYLSAGVLAAVIMDCAADRKYLCGMVTYGLLLCCPITVINSGFLAQSDGIYAAFALLAYYCILKDKPIKGMVAFGFAFAMKLQAVFALPVLAILYWCKKKFSALHLVWIPVTMQVLCIPAIAAGCGFDIALKVYKGQMGEYPFMYYFYPNIWTYFQELPYYAFGIVAISMMLVMLLMYAVLVVQSGREHTGMDYLEYFVWTAMTCVMFLPCMHERYNYLAELLLIAWAVVKPRMRIPAAVLGVISTQCYIQYFLGGYTISPYFLAAGNIAVYLFLTKESAGGLLRDWRANSNLEIEQAEESV